MQIHRIVLDNSYAVAVEGPGYYIPRGDYDIFTDSDYYFDKLVSYWLSKASDPYLPGEINPPKSRVVVLTTTSDKLAKELADRYRKYLKYEGEIAWNGSFHDSNRLAGDPVLVFQIPRTLRDHFVKDLENIFSKPSESKRDVVETAQKAVVKDYGNLPPNIDPLDYERERRKAAKQGRLI